MVDEQTQLKFTDFFKMKDGMIEPTCKHFNNGSKLACLSKLSEWMEQEKTRICKRGATPVTGS
jgi:hypothetical protein